MMFSNIAIKEDVRPIPQQEVEDVERQLGVRFPHGYHEYMFRFGEGVLGGSFIRFYPPQRIVRDLVEWRTRIAEYWFWEQSAAVLSKGRALQCIVLADTLNGDEMIFHPSAPDEIFVLPRDKEDIFAIGPGLPTAIEWCCSAGVLTEPFGERVFEAFSHNQYGEQPA